MFLLTCRAHLRLKAWNARGAPLPAGVATQNKMSFERPFSASSASSQRCRSFSSHPDGREDMEVVVAVVGALRSVCCLFVFL